MTDSADPHRLPRRRLLGAAIGGPALLALPRIADAAPVATQRAIDGPADGRWLFTELSRAPVGPDIRRVVTAGRSAVGRFAAAYALDASQEEMTRAGRFVLDRCLARGGDRAAATRAIVELESRIRVRLRDGRWFLIDEPAPLAGHFGAIGDAVYTEATGTLSGTDDTAALQALIDWTIYWYEDVARGGTIRIGSGGFRLTRTLHVGRNDGYFSALLVGDGMGMDHAGAGTRLFADHRAGPAVAMSGIMNGGIQRMNIRGALLHRIIDLALGDVERNRAPDDLDIALWTGDEPRYAPYAGVAVDPYRGDRPASGGYDSAPDHPAWLDGRRDLYGNAIGSSALSFEMVQATGFGVGFVVQPSDSDGNGDFTRFRDCTVTHCGRGWSVGNSQARAVELSACIASNIHTVLATSAHGRRNGAMRGRIDHLSVGAAINLFDFGNALGIVGPLSFVHLYAEAIYRLGHIGAGTDVDAGLRLEDCNLSFDRTTRRGTPAYLIGTRDHSGYGRSGNAAPIVFSNCLFNNFGSVLTLYARGVRLTDCVIANTDPQDPAARRAVTLMAALSLAEGTEPGPHRYTYLAMPDGGGTSARTLSGEPPTRRTAIDKAMLTASRLDGADWQFQARGFAGTPGDALFDLTTGCLFAVRTVAGDRISARLLAPTDPADPAPRRFDPANGQARLIQSAQP